MSDNDTNAFPYPISANGIAEPQQSRGMTLRDYFAAKAMQAIITLDRISAKEVSEIAYMQADAMLAERNKGREEE